MSIIESSVMSEIPGIFRKRALLTIHNMLSTVPHMQPYSHAADFHEVVKLLGRLGNAPDDEAIVQLTGD
jgi:hypothetical protein